MHRGRDIDWVGLQCTCAAGDEGGAEDNFRSGEKPHPSSSLRRPKGVHQNLVTPLDSRGTAQRCFTWLIGREAVCSTWYGRHTICTSLGAAISKPESATRYGAAGRVSTSEDMLISHTTLAQHTHTRSLHTARTHRDMRVGGPLDCVCRCPRCGRVRSRDNPDSAPTASV